MPDDTLGTKRGSFPDLYADTLWNLYFGAQVMKVKLPSMADKISDPGLATLLRDTLGQASHAAEQVRAMLSHFAEPARVHAAEVETLVGDAARRLADWPPGAPRDVALSIVVRAAVYTAIPGCDLAIVLAEVLGYEQHIGELKALRERMRATDESLRPMIEERIRAGHADPPLGV